MNEYAFQDRARRDDCPLENRKEGHGHSDIVGEILQGKPNAQVLFVGSLNCIRHKPFMGIAKYMREKKFSFLCPSMTDFASGRYLQEIKDAVGEIAAERDTKEVVLIYSCQWVILSTDGELLQQEVQEDHGVTLHLFDDSHLVNGDHS